MPKSKLIAAITLFLALRALPARGAASALPPDVIAADTVGVVHADAAHFNPDKLQAAATAMLADDAKELDEPIGKFKEMFGKITVAGVDAMTMVVGAPKKDDPEERRGAGILYLTLKPDADVKAIEAFLTEKILESGDKREIVFEQAGDYLAMHHQKQVFPVKPDPVREAAFAEALKSIGDASIQVAFIPDAAGREQMKEAGEDADDDDDSPKDIRPVLSRSNWMAFAIYLGSAPHISASASAANEADAKALADGIKADLDDVKAETHKPGPMMLAAPLIEKVINGLQIGQTGTRVSVSINAETLKLVADFADSMGVFNGDRR